MLSNWNHFLESLSSGKDWERFSQKISNALKSKSINYPFSVEDYYVLGDELTSKWRGDYELTHMIGKRESFREVNSEPSKIWVLKQISDKLGGGAKICDMGCGLGLVVLFCQKMGLDAIGVEWQKRLMPLHKEIGINVKYGDFFTMNLSFLKEMDIIYLYQPVKTAYDSLELLDLISANTSEKIVILYNGMWDSILKEIKNDPRFNVYYLDTNHNYSNLVLIKKSI